ncbi:MAG TPA: hypothetical protein VGO96_00675 [Pyrinomonadaceae bacterium]|jgi:hypothetical protein|nr:hypothetical protein [Pyrinomonadaceae bacterium]
MNRVVRRIVVAALSVFAFCVAVAAQEPQPSPRDATGSQQNPPAPRAAPTATPVAQNAANVDENFELNIAERRITERDFYASTAIETEAGEAHGLSLRVGVGVGASEIDVLLRNVRGSVRFRGSLDALRRILDARREPAATTPPAAVVP